MARMYFTAFILVFFSSQLIAQDISPTDFRIPESRYKNLLGSLQGSYGNQRFGTETGSDKSNGGTLGASLNSIVGYNSENEAYTMNSHIDGTYNHNFSRYNYSFLNWRTESQTREGGNINLTGQYSSYLTPDKIYVYGSAYLNGSYDFYHTDLQTDTPPEVVSFRKNRTIDGAVGAGAGYGKMREASSVFTVVRILEKLSEDGYLTRDLTKEEILGIVDIYARRIEYVSHYDRPTKYFLDDLLKKLESFGVLKDQRTTAYETARVEEVFQEFIFPRMVGWTVQAGVSIGKNQTESSSSDVTNLWNVMKSEQNYFTASAQYGYPFSLALHWYSQAAVSVPIYGGQKIVNQYLQSKLYYQIGEKISNELNAEYSKYSQYETNSVYPDYFFSNNSLSIGNTFRYFLENNINFSITARYTDWMNHNQSLSNAYRSTQGGVNISFGLNYRFF